ncbi:TPA: hypothetical protein N3K28_002881 [Listeria monocytogenes]|uniref:hypothetical protein n=1 Tax=Listeria monocytogenes TaxID=1639 RepID=UPI001604D49A|nr:hypothetical protein [Listeria monocytogenes]HCM5009774.1 hypothetical protein [Listeria monocytogenes]HCQ1404987.1 hypothetical protein [Listeria monocytogenes]
MTYRMYDVLLVLALIHPYIKAQHAMCWTSLFYVSVVMRPEYFYGGIRQYFVFHPVESGMNFRH